MQSGQGLPALAVSQLLEAAPLLADEAAVRRVVALLAAVPRVVAALQAARRLHHRHLHHRRHRHLVPHLRNRRFST